MYFFNWSCCFAPNAKQGLPGSITHLATYKIHKNYSYHHCGSQRLCQATWRSHSVNSLLSMILSFHYSPHKGSIHNQHQKSKAVSQNRPVVFQSRWVGPAVGSRESLQVPAIGNREIHCKASQQHSNYSALPSKTKIRWTITCHYHFVMKRRTEADRNRAEDLGWRQRQDCDQQLLLQSSVCHRSGL